MRNSNRKRHYEGDQKDPEIEKCTLQPKSFKSEILQLIADELNYSLCQFVKYVRKLDGTDYAPDRIYYLVMGVQQYLFEDGRIDNIFPDTNEPFTDCLDEVAKKFSVLYNDSQYIVTASRRITCGKGAGVAKNDDVADHPEGYKPAVQYF